MIMQSSTLRIQCFLSDLPVEIVASQLLERLSAQPLNKEDCMLRKMWIGNPLEMIGNKVWGDWYRNGVIGNESG